MDKCFESDHLRGCELFHSPEKFDKSLATYNPYLADCYAMGLILFCAIFGVQTLEDAFTQISDGNQPSHLIAEVVEGYLKSVDRFEPINIVLAKLLAKESEGRMQAFAALHLLDNNNF